MFKVNNNDTRKMPMALTLKILFKIVKDSVFIVNFQQVITNFVRDLDLKLLVTDVHSQ